MMSFVKYCFIMMINKPLIKKYILVSAQGFSLYFREVKTFASLFKKMNL